MREITFPVSVSYGAWSGDNDVTIEITEKEFSALQRAIEEAEDEGWPELDEEGRCARLFPRIRAAIFELLEDLDLDFDTDDIEFSVGIPEIEE